MLDFDCSEGALILQVTGISCEKDSRSGNSNTRWQNSFRRSYARKESIGWCCWKSRIFPKDVSQVT